MHSSEINLSERFPPMNKDIIDFVCRTWAELCFKLQFLQKVSHSYLKGVSETACSKDEYEDIKLMFAISVLTILYGIFVIHLIRPAKVIGLQTKQFLYVVMSKTAVKYCLRALILNYP